MIWVSNKIHHVYNTKGKGRGSLFSIIDGCTDLKDHKTEPREMSRNSKSMFLHNSGNKYWSLHIRERDKKKKMC